MWAFVGWWRRPKVALTEPKVVASLKYGGHFGPRGEREITAIGSGPVLLSAAVTPSARLVLLVLIGLLLVVLGVLIAVAVVVRRRSSGAGDGPERASVDALRAAVKAAPREPSRRYRSRAHSSTGMMAVAIADERVACPTCGQEYDAALRYCPADARELVPVTEVAQRARDGSAACVTCHRAFEQGVRYCPHDASELVPIAVYEATRGKVGYLAPTGEALRVCPQCQRHCDWSARFCPHDGTELSVLH
jgi:hypothetical protein